MCSKVRECDEQVQVSECVQRYVNVFNESVITVRIQVIVLGLSCFVGLSQGGTLIVNELVQSSLNKFVENKGK